MIEAEFPGWTSREKISDEQKLIRHFLSFHKPTEDVQRYNNSSFKTEKNEKMQQSLAEHVNGMLRLAEYLFDEELIEIDDVDQTTVRKMIRLHDQHEIYTDDVVEKTDSIREIEVEADAHVQALLKKLGKQDEANLLQTYHEQATPEAKLVKAIDRLEAYLSMMYSNPAFFDQERSETAEYIAESVNEICPILANTSIIAVKWLRQENIKLKSKS